MRMMNEFRETQAKIDALTGTSRQDRETAACLRRLEQMRIKREKAAKRKAHQEGLVEVTK
jgi:hypothetical protein